ncbi:UNVERIFIED_CONTAM: hypothetical protein Slati_0226400 [Sesamum latifolium]|uniref:Uncharacterized protein n=1 Tax=Sesamum latifolium TaxID=2727402 RepID=A0AAW2YCE9_9LAMI
MSKEFLRHDVIAEGVMGSAQAFASNVEVFQLCLADCGPSDLGFTGYKFTWCNNRVHPATVHEWGGTLRKLSESSDLKQHGYALMTLQKVRRDKGFRASLCSKSATCGERLKKWNYHSFEMLPRSVSLKGHVCRRILANGRRFKRTSWKRCFLGKNSYGSNEGKLFGSKLGDRNTMFFYAQVTEQHWHKLIKSLKNEYDVNHTTGSAIQGLVQDYFRRIFTCTTPNPDVIDECLTCLTPKVNDVVNTKLFHHYTVDEAQRVLNQMHPLKSTGLDNMSLGFFQKFWSIT